MVKNNLEFEKCQKKYPLLENHDLFVVEEKKFKVIIIKPKKNKCLFSINVSIFFRVGR